MCGYLCVMSTMGTNGPGSVKFYHCEENMDYCQKRQDFYDLAAKYQEEGADPAAALWKAHVMLDIPTAYTITGEVRGWLEKYWPEKYQEALKQENAFLRSAGKLKEPKQYKAPEQISIEEFLEGLKNEG